MRGLESRKRELESSIRTARSWLENDYGRDGQFAELQGKCFEWKQRQYTYAICPYDKAEQKENHSGTSLGKWKGWYAALCSALRCMVLRLCSRVYL